MTPELAELPSSPPRRKAPTLCLVAVRITDIILSLLFSFRSSWFAPAVSAGEFSQEYVACCEDVRAADDAT